MIEKSFRRMAFVLALLTPMAASGVAIGNAPPTLSESERVSARNLFVRFAQAIEHGDGAALARLYDVDRLGDRIHDAGEMTRMTGERRRAFGSALRRGIAESLNREGADKGSPFPIRDPRIPRIEPAPQTGEWIAIVENADDQGHRALARWWLSRNDGTWRIVDREDPVLGLRISTKVAMNLLPELYPNHPHAQSLELLELATNQLDDMDMARDFLLAIEKTKMPQTFDAHRHALHAMVLLQHGQCRRAIHHLEIAKTLVPDVPAFAALKATSLQRLGRFGESRKELDAYRRVLGEDAAWRCLEARALAGTGNTEAGARLLLAGLERDANSEECWAAYGLLLPRERKAELGKLLDRHRPSRDMFSAMAERFFEEGDADALEVVSNAFAQQLPQEVEPCLYGARACFVRREFAKGAEMLGTLRERVDKETWEDEFELEHRLALCDAKKWTEAYALASNPSLAFRQIAERLETEEDLSPLAALAELHREKDPDDPWLDYVSGVLLTSEGKFDQAEVEFKAGADRVTLEEDREIFRVARVEARYAAGQALSAYARIPPRTRTFAQLADVCFEEEEPDLLENLIEAHRTHFPKDPRLMLAEAELHWLRGDYAGVSKCLADQESSLNGDDSEDLFAKYLDLRVRALARLGRYDEALEVAKSDPEFSRDPFRAAIVHAARRDVAATDAVVERCLEWTDATFFDFLLDQDIGKSLGDKAFLDWRCRWMAREYDLDADEILILGFPSRRSLDADKLRKEAAIAFEIADHPAGEEPPFELMGRGNLFEARTRDFLYLIHAGVGDWKRDMDDADHFREPPLEDAIAHSHAWISIKVFALHEEADLGEIRRHAGRLANALLKGEGTAVYFPRYDRVALADPGLSTKLAGPRPFRQLGSPARISLPEEPLSRQE